MSRISSHHSRPRRLGFTLVELMISVAIVLVLMLGINYVFSTSARTISTGMAVTGVTREIRGARKVFENDFRAMRNVSADEQPALIIHNEIVYAWKDKQDKLTDEDNDPSTFDVDGAPGEEYVLGDTNPAGWTAANSLPGVYNFRRHRVDRISFFARNSTEHYARQTGDDNTYINNTTSAEAWIQYGLLRLADNNGIGYWKPGARGDTTVGQDEQGNQNNFFATQWVLGRKLMLLVDPTTLTQETTFFPATTANFGLNFGVEAQQRTATGSQPFNRESPPYPTAKPWRAEESRVDLVAVGAFGTAGTGSPIQRMRARTASGVAYWIDSDTSTPGTNRDRRDFDDSTGGLSINYLSWAKPYVNKSNFANSIADQTREMALMTPIFLRGCTQFIVEFAGDFYDQGPIGGAPEPLGTIDYVEVPGPGGATGTQIRWYGMPRDTNGTAGIQPSDTKPLMGTGNEPFMAGGGGAATPRFTGGATPSNTTAEKPRAGTAPYVFAWSPTIPGDDPVGGTGGAVPMPGTPGHPNNVRPSLIRITMELIDPNGRLEDGQRIEFVFRLK